MAFDGLDHFPGYGAEEGVDVGGFHVGPDCRHVGGGAEGGVVEFAGEHEEGFSMDD